MKRNLYPYYFIPRPLSRRLCIFAAAASLVTACGHAAVVAYEGFSGSGDLGGTTGGFGWNGGWVIGTPTPPTSIGGTGMNYQDSADPQHALVTSPGVGMLGVNGTSGRSATRTFAAPLGAASGTWYLGFMMQCAPGTVFSMSMFGTAGERVAVQTVYPDFDRLQLYGIGGAVVLPNVGGNSFSPNNANLYVVRLDLGGGTNPNTTRLSVYVNPTDLSASNFGAASFASVDNLPLFDLTRMGFVSRANQNLFFDEIRLGTTAADVMPYTAVPEPSETAVGAGLILGGWIWVRRGRAKDTSSAQT